MGARRIVLKVSQRGHAAAARSPARREARELDGARRLTASPTHESLDIPGPAGRLEAILMNPAVESVAAGVVCHAHPLHGGVMHYKVVFRAAKALQHQGVAALRFNFRGVGRSEGAHDHGLGEQEDARAALFEVQARFPGLPLVLGGFSFGSVVSLAVAARDARVHAVFALGFPLRMADPAVIA